MLQDPLRRTRHQFSLVRCAVLGVATCLAAGCAMPISVRYSPLAATETLKHDTTVSRIYVAKFVDGREKADRIGEMNNMYGMPIKKLVTTDDLGTVLAEATTDALRKAGLDAELHLDRTTTDTIPDAEMHGYDLLIGGKISHVKIKGQPGWDTVKVTAEVVIEVYLADGSRQEWVGPIEGRAERREMNYAQSDALSGALDTAIQNCMRNMVRHFKASGALRS